MSQLTNNTTSLQAILDKVNALPEAGSGGGSVETCTVNLNTLDGLYITGYAYTAYENGTFVVYGSEIAPGEIGTITSIVLENVVCGTMMAAAFSGGTQLVGVNLENIERIGYVTSIANGYYKTPSNAGDAATITAYDND